jgi:hypothetical protein
MEVLIVAMNTQVKGLEELVIHKLAPLIIPEIGVRVEVTLINIVITHAFEVLKTLDTILTDTLVHERPRSNLISLVEHVDTTGGRHVNDLATKVEHVILGD